VAGNRGCFGMFSGRSVDRDGLDLGRLSPGAANYLASRSIRVNLGDLLVGHGRIRGPRSIAGLNHQGNRRWRPFWPRIIRVGKAGIDVAR